MKKRSIVRIVSFSLCITVVSLLFAFKAEKANRRYILQLENGYSYMLDELNTASNNITTILNKARFATTKPQLSKMAGMLLTEAEISKSSLSQLPVSEQLSSLNRFYSQVGNYAISVANNLSEGSVSQRDIASIELLNDISKRVSEALNNSRESYNNLEYWAKQLDSTVEKAVDTSTLSASLSELEGQLKDYPTLIYDGPYSDHLLEKEPTLLRDTADVSIDEALKTAAKWSGTNPESLELSGTTDGKIPTLDFMYEGVNISVTKKGGYVLFMRKTNEAEEIILNYDQALLKAHTFLSNMGMKNLKETYYFESDGICTINFAFLDGKTLCYTDLVKVGVSMDSGDIVLYEAGGYISNHKARAFETPSLSEEEAKALISPKLTVNSTRFALIPTNSPEEKRCYEFACTSADNQEVLVYINTATPSEEEILILQKSDGGILVK